MKNVLLKNALRYALPTVAAAGALLLLLPTETEAWNPLGGSLNLNQRDVRLFNNFSNVQANNNNQTSAQFPGYTGAELALWKAIVEWGSLPHGDGSGDPLQTTLGNGGANFDPSWQGNALVVGTVDNNICSRLDGGGTGTYAFVESPISNGWRMRFLTTNGASNPWLWQDGPGDEDGGQDRPDLQGIITHEYGHSLGLDHTNVSGATMFASVSTEGSSNARSIAPDDIAGVQGVYGVAAGGKPVITDVNLAAFNVEITGSNFDATNNEVWFTQDAAGGGGTPIKATGVPSSGGGTFISVTVPAAAGSGDVLVRLAGAAHSNLSNAFPFDADAPSFATFCNLGDNSTFFCPCNNPGNGAGGCDNAQGTGGVKTEVFLFLPNGPSAGLLCTGYPSMSSPTSIIIRGQSLLANAVTFGDGLRCVDVPVVRLAATFAQNGQSAHTFGHGAGAGGGSFHYQPWYRNTPQSYCDPAAAFNLGSGVTIVWP